MSSSSRVRAAKRRVAPSGPQQENEDPNIIDEGFKTVKQMPVVASPKRVAKRRNIKSPPPVNHKNDAVPFHDVTQAMANMKVEPNWQQVWTTKPNADQEEPQSTSRKKTDGKPKKKVGFISSQPTEVLTYEKDEAPEINLASILSRSSSRTAAFVPVSPASQRRSTTVGVSREDVVEEELAWDEDDEEGSCFSLHDLQVEVRVTRDTEQMSLSELRRELTERGKSASGTKAELVKRLNSTLRRARDVECGTED